MENKEDAVSNISIIATTDIHGFVLEKNSGIYRLPSILSEYACPILIDNGDYLIGSPESTYINNELKDGSLMKLANKIGYDVMIPGNHDFDYGIDFLKEQVSLFHGDYLCANLLDLQDRLIFKPYTIIERKNIKIGIIGVVTKAMPQISRYSNIHDLKFLDVIETLQHWVPIVEKESDMVIVSYHGGIERNMRTGEITQYDTGEDQTYRIIKEVKGIDGIICGHQHRENFGLLDSTLFVQPGYKGNCVGVLDYSATSKGVQGKSYLFHTHNYNPDYNLINLSNQDYESWLDTKFRKDILLDYISDRVPNTIINIELNNCTYRDILTEFTQPYSLSTYHLSKKEIETYLSNHDFVDSSLRDYRITTNSKSIFPSYRLEENFVYNIFDEFIRYYSVEYH